MKKIVNIFIVALVIFVYSCSFEDKSTYVTVVSPEIIIDTTGIPNSITINREDNLIITPKVSREGTPQDKFSYEWILTTIPGSDFTSSTIISTEETLNSKIDRIPDANKYSLWYRVTDNTTGLMKSLMWSITVEASSGQGLIVAYTKDNMTSDLAVVQDTLFTSNYKDKNKENKPRAYKFNVFSQKNNKTFNGVIKSMFAQTRYHDGRSTYMLHGASDNNCFRIATLDYELLLEGKEMFYDPFVELDITAYNLIAGYAMMMNKGKIAVIGTERQTATVPNKVGINVPGNYYINPHYSDISPNFAWYDETEGKFMYNPTYLSFGNPPSKFVTPTDGNVVFDPNNMPGYKALAGGYGNKSDHRFILKKDDEICLYTLNRATPFTPRVKIDLSSAPEIENAVDFLILRDQETLLYATAHKVYAVIFTSSTAVEYKLFYETTENITNVKMLRKTGSKAVPYAEKCVLVITNQNNRGNIHAIKLGNTNTGEMSGEVTVLTGFDGRITAVAVQD